jgi:hypothetical protein
MEKRLLTFVDAMMKGSKFGERGRSYPRALGRGEAEAEGVKKFNYDGHRNDFNG